jgi:thiol-disulfide isomerase/thioredoxin
MSEPANVTSFEGDYAALCAAVKAANRVVIVDFYTTTCSICTAFAPAIGKAAKAYPNIAFFKCNSATSSALATRLGAQKVPALKAVKINASGNLDELGGVGPSLTDLKELCKQVSS